MILTTTLEGLLFAADKPLSFKKIKKELGVDEAVLREAVSDIQQRYNRDSSGIHLMEHEGKLQLVTNPEIAEDVAAFFEREAGGDLTRPQLETLTIIAYRGPVTQPELEHVRGVNCTLILRNLKKRGLINEREDKQRLQPVYTVSDTFLKHTGLHSTEELPQYEAFHDNVEITNLLEDMEKAEEVE